MAEGVACSLDRATMMFPSCFMNSSRLFAVSAGPRPFDFAGRRRTWSYARSPCFKSDSLFSFGDSTVVVNPRATRHCQRWSVRRWNSIESSVISSGRPSGMLTTSHDRQQPVVHPILPIAKRPQSPHILIMKNINLHVKSSRNTLYFSLSACSPSTTSNRLPVKLLACTTTDQTKATVTESNHLIL